MAGQRVALRTHTSGGALTPFYPLSDHLGSTTTTLDSNNNAAGTQQYYPYGATRTTSGNLQTDYGFTGQRADTDIGLYFTMRGWIGGSRGQSELPLWRGQRD